MVYLIFCMAIPKQKMLIKEEAKLHLMNATLE